MWPHLHLFHFIRRTHQFSSSIHPCRPSSTFISRLLSNLASSIVIDCNTIDMIYNMICALQQGICFVKNGDHKSCLKFPFF
jgi:hypothetical protein